GRGLESPSRPATPLFPVSLFLRLPLPLGEGWGEGLSTEPLATPLFPNPSPRGRREISNSKFLFVTQCLQRIDFRCSSAGYVAGNQRHTGQQQRDTNERCRIVWGHAKEHGRHQ